LDTLKSASFGVKNPVENKEARIAAHKRYYPQNGEGHNEWAAVEANQFETATKLQSMKDHDKRELMTNEYGKVQYQEGLDQIKNAKEIHAKRLTDERVNRDLEFENFKADLR